MSQVMIEVTQEKLQAIGEPIAAAVNEAQMKGYSVDEVLTALMVFLGGAIRQRGAILHLDKPLREALPPIALGYEDSEFAAVALDDMGAQKFRRWLESAAAAQ